jgi:hypothetical protein
VEGKKEKTCTCTRVSFQPGDIKKLGMFFPKLAN